MTGPLDLSDANLEGFAPLDPGRYNAEIFEMTWDATKGGPEAKLPKGSPLLKIQVRVLEPQINGAVVEGDRRAFGQFAIPPKDYDPKKRATMLGMVGNFFQALGYDEKQVKDPKFMNSLDFEDLKERPLVVVLGKEPKKDANGTIIEGEFNNPIKGYKPAGTLVGSGTKPQGLL